MDEGRWRFWREWRQYDSTKTLRDYATVHRPGGRQVRTPTTPSGLRRYDHLPADEAVVRAWVDAGVRPRWHERMRRRVTREMPVLARALERLAHETHVRIGLRCLEDEGEPVDHDDV